MFVVCSNKSIAQLIIIHRLVMCFLIINVNRIAVPKYCLAGIA